MMSFKTSIEQSSWESETLLKTLVLQALQDCKTPQNVVFKGYLHTIHLLGREGGIFVNIASYFNCFSNKNSTQIFFLKFSSPPLENDTEHLV